MARITVVETEEFDRMCRSLLTEAERAALVDLVAATPLIGTALGGGLRKFRFARPGGGKSGGYRVIHYFKADIDGPIFLLVIYAKNMQDNLTSVQRERLKSLGEILAATYGVSE